PGGAGFASSLSFPSLFFLPSSVAFSLFSLPDPDPNPQPPAPPMPGPPPPNNQSATSQPQITPLRRRTTWMDQRGGLRTIVARISRCATNPNPTPPPTQAPMTARHLTTKSVVMVATLPPKNQGCHNPVRHRTTSDHIAPSGRPLDSHYLGCADRGSGNTTPSYSS